MLIDSHCHLDRFAGAERGAVLARAREARLGGMLTIGTRWSERDIVLGLAVSGESGGPAVWCTVGTHPDHVGDEAPASVEAIASMVRSRAEIVGVGESGLDTVAADAPLALQEASFRAHVRAARLADVPLVIHARGADAAIAQVLVEETDAGGPFEFVLHCFASGRPLAETGLALGGYVSFSGILTFPKAAALREIARDVPRDRLLVETDAPFLAPVPKRGKTNEPGFVVHTAARLADELGMTGPALAALTTGNFFRLFRKAARPAGA